jgi:hypothetical protein
MNLCPLLIEVVVAVPGVDSSVQSFQEPPMPALVNPKYKQSASCGYEVMMVVQVVEVWGDVDVVFENHEGSKPESDAACRSISALRMDTIPFTPLT